MSKVVSRLEAKHQKVSDGSNNVIPMFQSFATVGHKEWFNIPIQPPAPTTTFSSAPTTVFMDLSPHDCKQIEHIVVRLTLSASGGDVQTVGAPYLFEKITAHADKASGQTLFTILPEQIVSWYMLTMNDEQQQEWAKLSNFALPELHSQNQKKYYYNQSNYIRNGESKQIYLPLPLNFLNFGALDMSHIANPIRFKFYASSSAVIDGSVANLSLDNMEMLVSGHQESDFDANMRVGNNKNKNHAYNFLSVSRLQVNTNTLTAGTATDVYLDSFANKCAFLLIVIKGSTTPIATDATLFDYYEIGKNGTISLQNASGKDLIHNGNPLNQTVIYEQINQQLGRKPYKGMYIIPFCEDIKKSLAGHINGYMQMQGDKRKIQITFDTAPTQEIHSISLGTTASSGSYRYAFENMALSDQDADYNDSTSDLLNIINAMPALADRGLVASSVSNNINTSSTHNVTYTARSGRVCDELGKLTILGNDGTPKVTSTSVTTYGDDGWSTGSSYQIEVFNFHWSKFVVGKDGSLSVEQL